MKKKNILSLFLIAFLLFTFSACEKVEQNTAEEKINQRLDSSSNIVVLEDDEENTEVDTVDKEYETHFQNGDYSWNSSQEVSIILDDEASYSSDSAVEIEGQRIEIKYAGVYRLSGSLSDGQIIVDTKDDDLVKLIFDNINIHSENSAAINIDDAEKVVIILAENSSNTLSDTSNYEFEEDEDEPNATLFSKADLSIYGEEGSKLIVEANYNDAISSKDGLVIESAEIELSSVDDGIRGKDYLVINNSLLIAETQGDTLKADNEEDANKGFIVLNDSVLNIQTESDAVAAVSDLLVNGGEYNIETNSSDGDNSSKGMKAGNLLVINSGEININSSDDALHSNNEILINGGDLMISSGDDGIHADEVITINDGNIQVSKSYEALETKLFTINDGNLYLVASDDGINIAGGNDSSGRGGFDAAEEGCYLIINGGYIFLNANGDGLDSNGSVEMNGGTVIVNGPTNSGNGPLDYNGSFQMNSGYLVAVGSSGMAQAPSESSEQISLLFNLDSNQSAGTLVNIKDSSGNNLLTFMPEKQFQSVLISSSEIEEGESYSLSLGGSASGESLNGLYEDTATVNSGIISAELSADSIVNRYGTATMGGGGMRGGDRAMPTDRPDMMR